MKKKMTKEERRVNKEILNSYHKIVTEDALLPLYQEFQRWTNGELPYYELTDKIHEFHKMNQVIWKKFNYLGVDDPFLLLEAKKKLGLLTEKEIEEYHYWFEDEGST